MEPISLGARLVALAHPLRIGAPVSALEICAKIRALVEQFEDELEQCASETVARPLRPGDVVRCLIGTALEHETRVTATEIRDGRHFVALDSNRGLGCTVPADTVRLVRHVDESGPLEDVHGPVAGDPPGVTVPASVTRAEFDDLARRLDERVARIDRTLETHLNHFKGLHHVSGRDSDCIDALYRRADDLSAKIDGVIAAAEKGDLALADGLDTMQERIRRLAEEQQGHKARLDRLDPVVDHVLDSFRVNGLPLRDHLPASVTSDA